MGGDIPALLDFCSQHGDGIFIVLCLALGGVELLLQSGALVRHVREGVCEVILPGLDLKKCLGEFVPTTSGVCEGRSEVGDDVGDDLWVEGLWEGCVYGCGRGEGLVVELTFELEGEVDGTRPVLLRVVWAVVCCGHGWGHCQGCSSLNIACAATSRSPPQPPPASARDSPH